MTDEQLKDLKESIIKGIAEGFNKVPNYDSQGRNIGDFTKPIDKDARREYFNNLSKQSKQDKIDDLQRQIEDLRNSKYSNKRSVRKKIKDLSDEQERVQFGISKKDIAMGFADLMKEITNIVSGITQSIKAGVDIDVAYKKSALQERKNLFDQTQKIFQANMEMTNVVADNVVTTITAFTTKTATEAARSLRQGAKTEAAARIKLFTQTQMAMREFNVAETERMIKQEKEVSGASSSLIKGVGNVAMGVGALFGPMGLMVGAIVGAVTNISANVIETQTAIDTAYKDFNLSKKKQENEIFKTLMGNITQVIDKVKKLVDGIDEAADALNDNIRTSDKIYRNLGLTFGYSGDKFASAMRKTAIQTARIFGITGEEMKSMQDSFVNNSSRSLLLTGDNYNQMTAMSRTFGISQGEVAGLMGTMNIFNVSMDTSYKMFTNMYHTITKMGLSTTKFAKDLTNNLKLAQKYNFKGGLKNMMELSKWAQQTRFNLSTATSFADKLVNGSLSDVLETSAKLQVLGGAAATYSDPFGMMYDAGADVGDMAKRMAAIFSDINPRFDAETGEFVFDDWFENKMINERAKILGMDQGEARDIIRQNRKQGMIDKVLSGFNLDKDTRAEIGNRAEWDNKTLSWKVKTINGPMKMEDIANMTDKQRARILLPNNEKDSLIDIAKNTRSMVELEEISVKYFQAVAGSMLYPLAKEASDKNIQTQNKLLSSQTYISELGKSMLETADIAAVEAQTTLDFINNNQPLIEDYRNTVKKNIAQIGIISEAEKNILQALEEGGINKMGELVASIAAITNEEDKTKRDKLIENLYNTYKNDPVMSRVAHILNGEEEVTVTRQSQISELLHRLDRSLDEMAEAQGQSRIPFNDTTSVWLRDSYTFWRPRGTKDGVGNTNGGIISGASNVRSINDGRFNVRTANTDQYLAAMPNGPIDKILQVLIPGLYALLSKNNAQSNDVNVNLGGSVEFKLNGATYNIDMMNTEFRNNPGKFIQTLALAFRAGNIKANGKSENNIYYI